MLYESPNILDYNTLGRIRVDSQSNLKRWTHWSLENVKWELETGESPSVHETSIKTVIPPKLSGHFFFLFFGIGIENQSSAEKSDIMNRDKYEHFKIILQIRFVQKVALSQTSLAVPLLIQHNLGERMTATNSSKK